MTSAPSDSADIRATPFVLSAAVLLGGALRCYRLASRGLWGDEIDLWFGALSSYRSRQMAPLPAWIHGAYLHLTGQFTSPTAFHVPSLVLGALAPLSLYLLGKQLFGRRAGLIAATLTALSPMAIFYSQEARPYALFLNLAALALFAALRSRLDSSPRRMLAAGALAAALMATHILAGPLLLVIAAWALWDNLRNGALRPLAMPLVWSAGAVAGAVWILNRDRPTDVVSTAYDGGLPQFAYLMLRRLGPDVAGGGMQPMAVAGTFVVAALAALGVVRLVKTSAFARAVLLLASLAAPAAVLYFTLGDKSSWRWERYLTGALPAYLVLIAGGCASFRRWRQPVAVAVALVFFGWGIDNWARRDTSDRSETQRRLAAVLARDPSAVNGVIIIAAYSPRLSAAAFTYFRTDHVPTWAIDRSSLGSAPTTPFVPPRGGDIMTPAAGLRAGTYLVVPESRKDTDALRALEERGLPGARRRDDLSGRLGFDVVEFPADVVRQAVAKP